MLPDISVTAYRERHHGMSDVADKMTGRNRADREPDDAPGRQLERLKQYLVEARQLGKPALVAQVEAAIARLGVPTRNGRVDRPKASVQLGDLYLLHVGGGFFNVLQGRCVASVRSRSEAERIVAEHRATGEAHG